MTSKVKIDLTKVDGNAFAIMGAWKQAAKRQGWSSADIAAVLEQCIQGNYNNLVSVIALNSTQPGKN